MPDDSRNLADTLFPGFCDLNQVMADAAQRRYAGMTAEERGTLWAERRAELDRVRAECTAKGIDL